MPEAQPHKDQGASADASPGSRASTEPSSTVSALTGFDPARCRNCAGEHWVCENHQDTPWESSGHSANCGAGAPCPVCNLEMACARYVPAWRSMHSAPVDGTEIIVCGGTVRDDGDWTDTDYPFDRCAIVRCVDGDWQGAGAFAHDAYRWHKPQCWMPTPKLTAIATEAHRAATVEQGAVHEGAGPKDIAQGPSQ